MASTSEDVFAAIESGEVDRMQAMLDDDPALATSRDAQGVSALMRSVVASEVWLPVTQLLGRDGPLASQDGSVDVA